LRLIHVRLAKEGIGITIAPLKDAKASTAKDHHAQRSGRTQDAEVMNSPRILKPPRPLLYKPVAV
jgi:hypothetical protein